MVTTSHEVIFPGVLSVYLDDFSSEETRWGRGWTITLVSCASFRFILNYSGITLKLLAAGNEFIENRSNSVKYFYSPRTEGSDERDYHKYKNHHDDHDMRYMQEKDAG